MVFNNKVYDALKFIAQIFLPGLGTFYAAIAAIYGFDGAFESEHVVGVIIALDTFLGLLLGLSSKSYSAKELEFDGEFTPVQQENGDMVYSLDLAKNPEALVSGQDKVVLKVNRP